MTLSRPVACLALLLSLAACGERQAAVVAPVAVKTAPHSSYVGRWAVSLAGCQADAWEFAKDRLSTAGEVACTFAKVAPTPAGYTVQAECAAQGPQTPQTFTLTFAGVGAAETMTVTGGPWSGPVALVRCPVG